MKTTLVILLASTMLLACGSKRGEEVRKGALIERVDGQNGLRAVVADVTRRLPEHDVLADKFAGVDMRAFATNLSDELCAQVGGSCAAKTSMLAARQLDQDEYDLFVELFVISMNESELPTKEQNDLIDALFAMRGKHTGRTANAGDAQ